MPRGGRRPGAGRPRKHPLKQDKPRVDKSKPLSISGDQVNPEGFEMLEETPGVIVKSSARVEPEDRAKRWVVREAGPKSTYAPWTLYTTSTSYKGMNKYYREYRRDSLTRSCINTLAFFATNKGFETQLEPVGKIKEDQLESFLEKYQHVKDEVDRINGTVNLDHVLRVAVTKAKIYGKAGFEIIQDDSKTPVELLPLDSTQLAPELDSEWQLTSFKYKGKKGFYQPEELLYFANNQLEADWEGLSDVEPVLDALETRRILLSEALKEASRVLWAGIGIHQVDTSNLTDSEAETALTNHKKQIKPGKHIVTNQKINVEIVDLKPDIQKLIDELEYLDQEIIGNFKVPRFLIGREKQFNRATAYAELESFVNGPIADIQRWLRRVLEDQWYDGLVRMILKTRENEDPPVRVKHAWNPITTADYSELIQSVSQLSDGIAKLYGQGLGALTREQALALAKKVAELLDIPESEFTPENGEGA